MSTAKVRLNHKLIRQFIEIYLVERITLGIGTLTSCYGMPIGPDDYDYEDEPGTEQDSGEQTEEAVKYNISDL